MATHHDDDAGNPEMNAALREILREKGEAMTKERLNLITAGKPGEKALYEEKEGGILVRRMPDDPLALRLSIGDPHDLDEGAYCVFRGEPSKAIELLEAALAALKKVHAKPRQVV